MLAAVKGRTVSVGGSQGGHAECWRQSRGGTLSVGGSQGEDAECWWQSRGGTLSAGGGQGGRLAFMYVGFGLVN